MSVGRPWNALLVAAISVLAFGGVGGSTLPAIAFAPAPTSASCTYDVTQGGNHYVVRPVEVAQSVVTFYSYSSASAHTPYVEAYASVLYLYLDTNAMSLHLVFHFNVDNAGSPDAITTVGIQGIPSGASAVVSDDPGPNPEFDLSQFPQGQFHYFVNTDGGVLGPLPTGTNWAMKVDPAHSGPDPMRTQKWVDGDGTRLPLDLSGQIVIESECNRPPIPDAGGPYSGFEGTPITFNAGGSSDPDGDPLTYTWDFQDDGVDDVTTSATTVPWTYPDDFTWRAELTVSDGQTSESTTVDVTAANVSPTVTLDALDPVTEGEGALVQVRVTDPGADAVFVEFDQGDTRGPYAIGQLFSPDDVPITTIATWGDDGLFPVLVTATDDDGGRGEAGAITRITNAVPGITAVTNPSATTYEEGDEAGVELRGRDSGSDDLRIEVDFGNQDVQSMMFFNDGVGPDPDPSPLGTYPFVAFANFTTRYVDDGTYTIRVNAGDDDGGVATLEFVVDVRNVPPAIRPFGPGGAPEGSPGSLTATATDAGADALTFSWEFELRPSRTETFPASGSPTTATSTADFRYGDDGSYLVRLTVADDDGGVAVYETTAEVANVDPIPQITQVQRPAAFVLRVAGEKWHDVTAIFYQDSTEVERLSVIRMPGSPDDQSASTAPRDLDLRSRWAANVVYTREDDPVNGEPNGANPAWIILRTDDGQEVWIHHTFNVQHPGTYEWNVDLTPHVAQLAIRFSATATDAGSDDLTFHWDFGDGTTVDGGPHLNDGAAADPPKSPDGTYPFTANEEIAHAFPGPGTYTLALTVTDDDGDVATATLVVTILG